MTKEHFNEGVKKKMKRKKKEPFCTKLKLDMKKVLIPRMVKKESNRRLVLPLNVLISSKYHNIFYINWVKHGGTLKNHALSSSSYNLYPLSDINLLKVFPFVSVLCWYNRFIEILLMTSEQLAGGLPQLHSSLFGLSFIIFFVYLLSQIICPVHLHLRLILHSKTSSTFYVSLRFLPCISAFHFSLGYFQRKIQQQEHKTNSNIPLQL